MAHNSDGEELPDDWFLLKRKGGSELLKKTYPRVWQVEEARQKRKFENQPHIRRAKMEHLELIEKRKEEEELSRQKAEAHHKDYLANMAEAKDKRRKAKQIGDKEEFEYWTARIKSIEEEDTIWRKVNA